jgi:hypothetical protein
MIKQGWEPEEQKYPTAAASIEKVCSVRRNPSINEIVSLVALFFGRKTS